MKNRHWVILAAGIGAVGAGLVALFLANRPTRIDREHFEVIAPGMTRQQVERVLGGPPRSELRERAVVWLPRDGKRISGLLQPGAPPPKFLPAVGVEEGAEGVWVGESGLIAARFNGEGLLEEKYFSTVHLPKLTPMQRLLRPISREATSTPAPAPASSAAPVASRAEPR